MIRNRLGLTMLAGWLFADLFLVLLLVGLAELPVRKPAPTPSPRPSTPVHERGLDTRPFVFDVEISPSRFGAGGGRALVKEVNRRIRNSPHAGRHAGFVLIFASGATPGAGQAIANDAYALLRRERLFTKAAGSGYWTADGDHFEFKIFFLK